MPILFGVILDQACTVWQKSCDISGSCWIYDNHKIGFPVFVLSLVVKIISTGSYLIAAAVYKPRPANEININLSDVNIDSDIQRTDAKQMERSALSDMSATATKPPAC